MKKQLIWSMLLCSSLICAEAAKMLSVADVFGNMSEDEITQQVKMGQQFLEELERNGTPEEKAQFEQLLLETLNSMSEQDFNDIQAIAKMVEPHLDTPQEFSQEEPVYTPTTETAKLETTATKAAPTAIDMFKDLINTIVQRIDDITQKIESSKECSEEFNLRWKNKATLSNMKRQIQQLRMDRLAQKLAKDDLNEDDKQLVTNLVKFQSDLNNHNNKLVIEDNFGLPTNRAQDQKHLAQTKEILGMFDDHIDSLMPKLEKFLRKWDPEALQLAKELEQRTKSANKQALDSQVRAKDTGFVPAPTSSYGQQGPSFSSPSSSFPGYEGGYGYPEEYNQITKAGYQGQSPEATTANSIAKNTQSPAQEAPKDQAATTANAKSASKLDDIVSALEDHLDQFNAQHADGFTTYLSNLASGSSAQYPSYPNLQTEPTQSLSDAAMDYLSPGTHLPKQQAIDWLNNIFTSRAKDIVDTFKSKFKTEFESIGYMFDGVRGAIKDMDSEALKKFANLTNLNTIEQRLNNYKAAYDKAINDIDTIYKANYGLLDDDDIKNAYVTAHTNLMKELKNRIEDPLDDAVQHLQLIRRKAGRQATRKQSQSK